MNRTGLSVIALAVGAVLIIGLFNIFKPQITHLANTAFYKVGRNYGKQYAGLTYNDYGNGHIEFIHGSFDKGVLKNKNTSGSWAGGFVHNTHVPKEIQKAKSIKFDDGIDTSHIHSMAGMFDQDPNLESVDFGNGFDTSNVGGTSGRDWGFDSMFENDVNLKHVNFGSKFSDKNINPNGHYNMVDMFTGCPNLEAPTGNVPPQVMNEYKNRKMSPVKR